MMRKYLWLLLLLGFHGIARGQTEMEYHYWFDSDYSTLHTVSSASKDWQADIDIDNLSNSLHKIHFQVKDAEGTLSSVVTRYFMVIPQVDTSPKNYRCWIDNDDTHAVTGTAVNGIIFMDIESLTVGLHMVHVMIDGNNPSPVVSRLFMKLPQSPVAGDMKLYYYIDEHPYDAKQAVAEQGLYHFDIDVDALSDGIHWITCFLTDEHEVTTNIKMYPFVKIPVGGQGISRYEYRLNDEETPNIIILPSHQKDFRLLELLPVETYPLRSKCFAFRVEEGNPVIYAKNEIKIRFWDAMNHFVDMNAFYVDEQVKGTVEATLLEAGIPQTIEKPGQNIIKWYKMDAEPGDSLQFKLDRAATIQLFSPSGEEVYNASGSESVSWGGCHAKESGTFYLALHDVTAAQGNTISLEYEHIDKYAVLRQDVCVVGNGGCSTITFEGNGFNDLYAVDLITDQGDVIHHVYLGHESNATTSVVFDFTDAVINQYKAVFHFTEADMEFPNFVTVEEAKDIEIETEVTYTPFFLRGGSTTYTIKVSNKGNMTSYCTPIYIYVTSPRENGIKKIKVSGLHLPRVFENIVSGDLDKADLFRISLIEEEIGDTHYFIQSKAYDESIKDSVFIWTGYFFADISPQSTKTISVKVSTHDTMELWATVPKKNQPISNKKNSHSARNIYCCWKDRIECLGNVVSDATSIANSIVSLTPGTPYQLAIGVADCLMGAINQLIGSTGKVLCDQEGDNDSWLDQAQKIMNGVSIINTLTTCASNLLPAGKFKELIKVIDDISSNKYYTAFSVGVDLGNCALAFTEKSPYCSPGSSLGGGVSSEWKSWDPNDITGYTAESGSKAVKDGLSDVWYTIEFENDPEFATAPAHDIYLTDELDATKFDLSTFTPTRIKIGNKSAELAGDKNFVQTIDMRPEINAIAQVEGTFDEGTGIARWHISSLDPMTMEPTTYVLDGVLPVNTDGNGIGELSFDIKLKDGLAHGTEVNNRAGIVFDTNETIMTPTWTNVIDRIAPESHIVNVEQLDNETASVSIEATDELSGAWRYDVYVQYGQGSSWWKAAENVAIDAEAKVRIYPGIDHGFYVVATDMAGNVETKTESREFSLDIPVSQIQGDANGDGVLNLSDADAIVKHFVGRTPDNFKEDTADADGDGNVNLSDASKVIRIFVGKDSSNSKTQIQRRK